MSKYCKPMGLYVTYLDCMECEDKECRQPHRKEEAVKRTYLLTDVGDTVYIVFASKREGYNNDVVLRCKVTHAMITDIGIGYTCRPEKIVTKAGGHLEQYCKYFSYRNENIDTGYRGTSGMYTYPVFTTKERCIKWLKGK